MKKIISTFLALIIFCVAFGTISISAETTAQNGQLVNYTYTDKNNYSYITLNEDSIVTFYCTQPIDKNGSEQGVYLKLYYNSGNKAGIEATDYEYLSTSDNKVEYTYTYFLQKGSYKFNYYLSYYSSYNAPITTKYMISYKPISSYKVKTPKLNYLVKANTYSYTLNFAWEDNADYDGIELWTKTNAGGWVLKQTTTNSSYYRTYGYTVHYYSGDIIYYKIRTYKKCVGFNLYSDFSNVVSMKKLSKPAIKVSSNKKKTATVSISKSTSGASNYEIYRSTKKNKGFKKVKTLKSKAYSWTNKKLKSKKTYYYKVRAVKKVGKDKMYSSFSSVKKIKVK